MNVVKMIIKGCFREIKKEKYDIFDVAYTQKESNITIKVI